MGRAGVLFQSHSPHRVSRFEKGGSRGTASLHNDLAQYVLDRAEEVKQGTDVAAVVIKPKGKALEVNDGEDITYEMVLGRKPTRPVYVLAGIDSDEEGISLVGDDGRPGYLTSQLDFYPSDYNLPRGATRWDTPQVVTIKADLAKVDPEESEIVVTIFHAVESKEPAFNVVEDIDAQEVKVLRAGCGVIIKETGGGTEVDYDPERSPNVDEYTVQFSCRPEPDVSVIVRLQMPDEHPLSVGPDVLFFYESDWDRPQTVTVTAVLGVEEDLVLDGYLIKHKVESDDRSRGGEESPRWQGVKAPSVSVQYHGKCAGLIYDEKWCPEGSLAY